VLKAPALEKVDKLTVHKVGQRMALTTHKLSERGIVVCDQLIEQRVFRSMSTIPMTGCDRTGNRKLNHVSRPCDEMGGLSQPIEESCSRQFLKTAFNCRFTLKDGNRSISDSLAFVGQTVGRREVDDEVWQVSIMEYDLGFFDKEQEWGGTRS